MKMQLRRSASSARPQQLKRVCFLTSTSNNHSISPTTMQFSTLQQMKIYWQKLWNMRLNCGAFCAPRPKEMFLKWTFVQGCILAVTDKAPHRLHSGQFSHSVVSDSLRPHGLQHVHHQLPELPQTHVHRVGDAIQPSHPLLSLSSPAFNLSQHLGLFKWVSSSHQVVKVLEFQLQHQSSQ